MAKDGELLKAGVIKVAAHVDAAGAPSVAISWGVLSGRLTPDEARATALSILVAAEAADTDEFLIRFARHLAPTRGRNPAEWLVAEVHRLRRTRPSSGGKN